MMIASPSNTRATTSVSTICTRLSAAGKSASPVRFSAGPRAQRHPHAPHGQPNQLGRHLLESVQAPRLLEVSRECQEGPPLAPKAVERVCRELAEQPMFPAADPVFETFEH